jgi:branched-chain amino acid aminotransferase
MAFVNINGKILTEAEYNIAVNNRAYLYGDGLFESMKVFNGNVFNLENHISRILSGAKMLKMRIPSYFSVDYFSKQIKDLICHSGEKQGGKIRLSLDRTSGGTYLPDSNEVDYVIEYIVGDSSLFKLNERGLEVDVYTEMKKPINKLSSVKSKNGLLFVMASIAAKEKELDDVLLLNDKGQIVEATSSNLMIVSNGVLYTPGLDDGVLAGTMRMLIINLALKHGIKVYECSLMPQNLLAADEILLINAISGIRWVGGYRTKRYRNDMAKRLVDILNQLLR